MASGRRPLFDLMTNPSRNPRAGAAPTGTAGLGNPVSAPEPQRPTPAPMSPSGPPAPAIRPATPVRESANAVVETKPRVVVPARPEPSHASENSGPATGAGASPRRDAVTIPIASLYWIVTAAVVIFAAIWWGGVSAGKRDAERRIGKTLTNEQGQPTGGSPNEQPVSLPEAPKPQETEQTPDVKQASTTGDLYVAGGWLNADPRQSGMNYLRLATLNRSDAVRAVDYLKSKGRQALAVPSKTVERGPDGGKNPSYFVYLLTPLTRDQYRDSATRARIENDVKALGKEWTKSKPPAPSDFGQPGWVKFD